MATFEIEANGKRYEIEAPDQAAALKAFQSFSGAGTAGSAGDGQWERGVLAPIEKNTATGEMRLAWPQIAIDIGNAFMAPGRALQGEYGVEVDPESMRPTTLTDELVKDTVALSAIPALGATGGVSAGAAHMAAGGMRPDARKLLVRALQDDRVPLSEVGPRMEAIGPDAVLADLGPRLQKQAQAIATMPGPGQRTVVDALRARAAGRDARIIGDVDATVGPATTPTAFKAGVKEQQTALSPFYERAFAEARRVDTSPVAANLDSLAVNLRGEAQKVVRDIRSMLNVVGTDQLDPNPRTLFEVRKAIDGMFDTVQDGNARRILAETRKEVDALLGQAVPGIKEVDAAFAQLAQRKEAFDQGQTFLDSGREALRPPEVDSIVRAASPDVLNSLSAGTRAEIDRIIGTTANNLTALKRALGGEGDWNRARLASVFGAEKADRLLQVVARELRYKALEDDAIGGSRTQVLKAAQDEVAGREKGGPGVVQSLMNLQLGTAGARVADKGLGWVGQSNRSARNAALADALVSRERELLARQLASGSGTAAVGSMSTNALARALMARGEAPWLTPGGR